MRWLTLIRHAQAAPADGHYRDFDRPLEAQGQHDARLMAEQLFQLQPLPQQLISSPAVRAYSTAQTVASALGCRAEAIVLAPEIYEATVTVLLRLLRAQQAEHVVLVGHNPGLSELGAVLAPACPELPTAGFAHLKFAIEDWPSLLPGAGNVLRVHVPARLRARH